MPLYISIDFLYMPKIIIVKVAFFLRQDIQDLPPRLMSDRFGSIRIGLLVTRRALFNAY